MELSLDYLRARMRLLGTWATELEFLRVIQLVLGEIWGGSSLVRLVIPRTTLCFLNFMQGRAFVEISAS